MNAVPPPPPRPGGGTPQGQPPVSHGKPVPPPIPGAPPETTPTPPPTTTPNPQPVTPTQTRFSPTTPPTPKPQPATPTQTRFAPEQKTGLSTGRLFFRLTGIGIIVILTIVFISVMNANQKQPTAAPRAAQQSTPTPKQPLAEVTTGQCLLGSNITQEGADFKAVDCSADANFSVADRVTDSSQCPAATAYLLDITNGIACVVPYPLPQEEAPQPVAFTKITTTPKGKLTHLSCWYSTKTSKGPKLTKISCQSKKARYIINLIVKDESQCESFTTYVLHKGTKVYCFSPLAN